MKHFLTETRVPTTKDQAWLFLSDAKALTGMTTFPKVQTSGDTRTYAGNTIQLKVGLPPIYVKWDSIIPMVGRDVFVDVGVKVPFPFSVWCHTHRVEERVDGVYMVDDLIYKSYLPKWFVDLFILGPMFRQRKQAILHHFSK
ncbi:MULTISPECIES: hypothetical protein [Exiguobacterium]|uniref:Ligand-binding SRPBCC domain-containing protein n=1 Tax=Exiguobacterium antarcticum TaxID=132920 RepID=A0ABT6R320_9BACL|nr:MULTISPECIES: hypothetical protein [Exiguobacterium]AFS69779.1 Hypothetical protein Eab7_0630 [Exiguobacterium antarcticum B7]MCT4780112.1 hypothetical protein [Exiguobacterium soli]MDI3235225.1 hypothetical protein [Exiguobacterium antarcticum]